MRISTRATKHFLAPTGAHSTCVEITPSSRRRVDGVEVDVSRRREIFYFYTAPTASDFWWFGRVASTARKGWRRRPQKGTRLRKQINSRNRPYLDPLSPLAPPLSSSAFFASAVSGTRNIGFEDAPSFMASRTMTL